MEIFINLKDNNMVITKNTPHNWIFWSFLFLIFCIMIYILRSVILPFATGIILGYLFAPWASFLEKKGMNRTLATLLVMITTILIFVPIAGILISIINEQLSHFLTALPHYVSAFIKKIEPVMIDLQDRFPSFDIEKTRAYIRSTLADNIKIFGLMLKGLLSKGFALLNLLSLILITPVVTFYMLRDWDSFVAKVDSLLPRKTQKNIRKQAKEIDKTLAGFIRGQVSVCFLLGCFYALGLYFVGLDLGLVIGFLAGILSFIPYVGSITGFVLSIILALAQFGNITSVISVIVVFALGQFLEGNFLTPKLVGDSVGLHPVWIMFALLAGGVLLGFLGLLIAVPTAAIIGVLIRHAIENYKHSNLYLEK